MARELGNGELIPLLPLADFFGHIALSDGTKKERFAHISVHIRDGEYWEERGSQQFYRAPTQHDAFRGNEDIRNYPDLEAL